MQKPAIRGSKSRLEEHKKARKDDAVSYQYRTPNYEATVYLNKLKCTLLFALYLGKEPKDSCIRIRHSYV